MSKMANYARVITQRIWEPVPSTAQATSATPERDAVFGDGRFQRRGATGRYGSLGGCTFDAGLFGSFIFDVSNRNGVPVVATVFIASRSLVRSAMRMFS